MSLGINFLCEAKISNMNVEILRSQEDYVTTTIFYFNDAEWLASPGGTKFSKPIKEMSKEELNVFLKSFCTSARKKDSASVYKSSSVNHLRVAS